MKLKMYESEVKAAVPKITKITKDSQSYVTFLFSDWRISGVVGAILKGFRHILFCRLPPIICKYVHLCKQTSNKNIKFEFFSQIISCICKTSILTQILPYQNSPIPWGYSDMPLYFKK